MARLNSAATTLVSRLGRLTLPSEQFKIVAATTDRVRMSINPMLYVTVAGSILTLYIMRRRVRLGRRTPTF